MTTIPKPLQVGLAADDTVMPILPSQDLLNVVRSTWNRIKVLGTFTFDSDNPRTSCDGNDQKAVNVKRTACNAASQ